MHSLLSFERRSLFAFLPLGWNKKTGRKGIVKKNLSRSNSTLPSATLLPHQLNAIRLRVYCVTATKLGTMNPRVENNVLVW